MPLKFVSKQKIFIAQYREDENCKNVYIKHTMGRDIEKLKWLCERYGKKYYNNRMSLKEA